MHIVAKSVMWRQPALPKQMFFMDYIFRISTNVQHVHCEKIHLSRSIATDDKNPLLPQLNQNNLSKKTTPSTALKTWIILWSK